LGAKIPYVSDLGTRQTPWRFCYWSYLAVLGGDLLELPLEIGDVVVLEKPDGGTRHQEALEDRKAHRLITATDRVTVPRPPQSVTPVQLHGSSRAGVRSRT